MLCPVCRAVNAEPRCRRCRADLALLFTLEKQRSRAVHAAWVHLCAGRLDQARAIAEGITALRNDSGAQRLEAVVSLLRGDFAGAWRHYHSATAV